MGYLTRLACAALLALAVLTTASAGVNTPQSGWYSGNPLLGPNAIRDLACSGSTCYASGDFGTLLKSTDSGATWSGIVTGLTIDLSRVRLAGGSPDRVLVGGGCALRRSDDGGSTFLRLPFTASDKRCPATLNSFSFPTAKTGYLVLDDGKVLATADGGRSFSRRASLPGGTSDILCTAERTCLAAGSVLSRTIDGGVSWTQVAKPGPMLVSLERADPMTLYAAGYGTVLKSTDDGLTWTLKSVQQLGLPRTIRCGDASHCLISTFYSSSLLRTADGGDTFTLIDPSSDATFAVAFVGSVRAIAAGALGSVEVSNDVGASWSTVGTRIAGTFTTLAAVSDSIAYAGGAQGVLASTADGGQTWSNVSPPTGATVTSLTGAGASRLYVLASDGTLQRSDNGGASYSLLNPGAARPVSIAAVDADRLLLLGAGIVRSDDAGQTFQAVQGPAGRAPVSAADIVHGAVFAYGPTTALVSMDRGVHWRLIGLPRHRQIKTLDFATPSIGYLLDTRAGVWRTADGGRHWQALQSLGSFGGVGLEFADAVNGYVLVRSFGGMHAGFVLRTADGGRSWHPQLISRSPFMQIGSGGSTDYILAGDSWLYATTTRGDTGSPARLTISARPTSLARPGTILVGGRLRPAEGREEIVVARLADGRWTSQRAIAASNGTFVTRWRLSSTSVFVAQVLGDAVHAGAGTLPLTVCVGASRR